MNVSYLCSLDVDSTVVELAVRRCVSLPPKNGGGKKRIIQNDRTIEAVVQDGVSFGIDEDLNSNEKPWRRRVRKFNPSGKDFSMGILVSVYGMKLNWHVESPNESG
jgi:hypothetical protein